MEQPSEFVDGDRFRPFGLMVLAAAAAVLVLVQADAGLGGLERFLDAPAVAGAGHQVAQRNRFGRPAAVERQFTGGAVAADQQPVVTGVLVGCQRQGDERPVARPL
nr:hypothetical protein [Micromonospora sp. WMMA1996]